MGFFRGLDDGFYYGFVIAFALMVCVCTIGVTTLVADSEKVKMAKLGYEEKIVFQITQDMKYPSTYKMWVKAEDKKVNENECK